MFKGNNGQIKNSGTQGTGSVNLIGVGTKIEGKVNSEGDIRIDGYVRGSITTSAKIVIGETATVNGDITCQYADISGKIKGKVTVHEVLTLKGKAMLNGDIMTNKFVVEPGAKFNGNCIMGNVPKDDTEVKAKVDEQKESTATQK